MQRTGHFAFYEEGLLHLALGLHALLVVEDLLADAQVLGSDLQQLVLSKELEAALEAQLADGDEAQSVVRAGSTGIGQVLGLADVDIDVPTQYQGAVMTGLGQRKAILQQMESLGSDRVRLEFRMPSRGLFGYRNQFLTDTHGEGIINQIFDGYDVWAGMIANRSTGSLVSFETGEAVTYGLFNAQQRGTLLVGPGEKVYEGMVIGYTASGEDVDVNVCKTKHLTNTRSSGSDDALRLIPISKLSLEGCLEFLAQDELLEVTPENLRIRKQILNHEQRMKAKSRMK